MDLFDLDCFYSRRVPILALQSPVIMFSACAFAARQLGMTSRQRQATGPPLHPNASERVYPSLHREPERNYTWIAEAYYDAAISLLRQHTSDVARQDHQTPQSTLSLPDTHAAPDCQSETYRSPGMTKDATSPTRLHEQVVVAVTILSCYEFLAGAAPNWSDHLDGTRGFLRLLDQSGFLDFGPPSPFSPSPSSAGPSSLLRAAFWNFARQDMLSASESQPNHTQLECTD